MNHVAKKNSLRDDYRARESFVREVFKNYNSDP